MKVQKWLSLGEAYAIPRLKKGSKTSVSGDKVIESLRTPHLVIQVLQVVYGDKGVKHRINMIKRGYRVKKEERKNKKREKKKFLDKASS